MQTPLAHAAQTPGRARLGAGVPAGRLAARINERKPRNPVAFWAEKLILDKEGMLFIKASRG